MAAKPKSVLFGKQGSLPSLRTRKETDSYMEGHEGVSCPVCCELYSSHENDKSPRILSSCGHTLCSGKHRTSSTSLTIDHILTLVYTYIEHLYCIIETIKQVIFKG